jgi:hypothetical protein
MLSTGPRRTGRQSTFSGPSMSGWPTVLKAKIVPLFGFFSDVSILWMQTPATIRVAHRAGKIGPSGYRAAAFQGLNLRAKRSMPTRLADITAFCPPPPRPSPRKQKGPAAAGPGVAHTRRIGLAFACEDRLSDAAMPPSWRKPAKLSLLRWMACGKGRTRSD